MGEQVTNGCSFGTGRIIKADESPLNGDEGRPRDDRFSDRGERKDTINVAVRIDDVALDTKDEGDVE